MFVQTKGVCTGQGRLFAPRMVIRAPEHMPIVTLTQALGSRTILPKFDPVGVYVPRSHAE